uniref:TATA-binding protein-associated factor 172 n=1 Tax=Anopheles coluzzii TaxID=1518534 RepID=A0A8W7P0R9_ANOCL
MASSRLHSMLMLMLCVPTICLDQIGKHVKLDRLFILLESGSAAVTRKAAAKQIGEVQKLHPHELHNLLSRLLTYLHSNSWDTRIAASQAVQAILENVPQWEPKPLPNLLKMETKEEAAAAAAAADDEEEDKSCDSSSSAHASGSRNGHHHHRLSFDSFDLNAVLFKGARLMGSEGSEFDPLDEGEVVDLREKLARQRALLNEKLGLSSGLNLEELVTLDDVRNNGGGGSGGSNRDYHQTGATGERLVPVQEILKLSRADSVEGLSCREKNRARRKARQQQQAFQNPIAAVIGAGGGGTTTVGGGTAAGNGSNGATAPGTATIGANEPLEPDRKRIKTEKGGEPGTPGGAANSVPAAGTWTGEAVPDLTGAWVDAVDWPLDSFCSKLFLDLFSPRWETRHGSATALRELLKSHADGGGKSVYMTRAEMERQHQLWLEDATLRLLCVLALDRFGDFVSDQVVAPVRETCAQVLGTVLRQLPLAKVHQTVAILLTFVKQKEWEVRHGGLLGIKYMLVVREDLIQTFLPVIINDVLTGLFDAVDDVGAVAASTLIPIATWLPKLLSRAQVSHIVKLLWDLLLDQDELASACNSFMGLLASILSLPSASSWIQMEPMSMLFEIVPYVVLLVVPLLGRMSDPDQSVRLVSTHCFATLIQLMPLDGLGTSGDGGASGRHLSDDLRQRKMKDRRFLEYLFSPKTIPDVELPVKINAELRSYQQSGVNWLWFLNRYKLHGILCDDMGLGKTLQAICILAADHHQRSLDRGCAQLPSIVICPPTLTGHWVYEVEKFLPSRFLRPLHYVGLPGNREQLRQKLGTYNLIVASYDIVRKDIEFFSSVNWNYCILDEGHIIKNGRTKSSKAIKQLVANHRLILSGTPIQNNVLELWSLFDFLMPGFLGTEKQFSTRFSRPILASRDPKSSPKEQEAGALAMEALHRQVLPFLLRRVKEDVLTDLPPKITQDLLCELSPLQERLYEDFSRMHLHSSDIRECLENIDGQMAGPANKKTHVFQALRYLQNVCNHPKLVLSPSHPEYQMIVGEFTRNGSSMDDIEHSAKLPVLKANCDFQVDFASQPILIPNQFRFRNRLRNRYQLRNQNRLGNQLRNRNRLRNCFRTRNPNRHRALIFCQLKAMLDIVENDLLKKHLPAVSYLRLDGSVPPSTRHHIVTKFNGDPSIDVLLLTTQVGGLGLNLTGADTVIFVEHDWNPMKDLQAMDRAHRIGQKKVVNVYRLITRKSLEEKIMGLQKFKLLTANTVVSDENASMDTMGTDQLLDLFTLADDSGKQQRAGGGGGGATTAVSDRRGSLRSAAAASNAAAQLEANGSNGGAAIKTVLENLPELWDDSQYHEEYDLSQFLEGLKKNRQP